ncbi:MAG: hypothetical protein AAFQ37_03255, partial [Bacteroidota bacterium]
MRITMLSAIVLLSFHLKAQVDSLTTFEVGLSFGQSFSTVDFSLSSRPENMYSSRTGVELGSKACGTQIEISEADAEIY